MTSATPFFSTNLCAANGVMSRQFSHRAITNADYRAYATACASASHQEDCWLIGFQRGATVRGITLPMTG